MKHHAANTQKHIKFKVYATKSFQTTKEDSKRLKGQQNSQKTVSMVRPYLQVIKGKWIKVSIKQTE